MPKTQLTQKDDLSQQESTSTSPSQGTSFEESSVVPGPTSRPLSQQEINNLTGGPQTPYIETHTPLTGNIDFDAPESWFYPGTEVIRPQTRVYRIIGRDGKPTGKIVYAKDEVQGAALRQESRDANGTVYVPAAELIDVVYED